MGPQVHTPKHRWWDKGAFTRLATAGRGCHHPYPGDMVACCAQEGATLNRREECPGWRWVRYIACQPVQMTACLALDLIEELLLLDVKAVTEHLIACASQHMCQIVSGNCQCESSLSPSLDISCTAENLANLLVAAAA